ncbi:hypothetical protein Holit_00194 [Hollandina sp. SP2]
MNYQLGIIAFLVMAVTFTTRTAFAQERGGISGKRLQITVGNTVLTARLIDNETARDFLTLLPMTVRVSDYVSREKYWHLPRALATGSDRENEYERGDLGFWIPNNDMALFYNHDGSTLPAPGLIVIARITSGLEIFNRYPGSVELKIELTE